MKKKKVSDSVTVNRRAHYDYQLGEKLVCGMSLSGPQVRLIRDHHVQLKGSYVTIRDNDREDGSIVNQGDGKYLFTYKGGTPHIYIEVVKVYKITKQQDKDTIITFTDENNKTVTIVSDGSTYKANGTTANSDGYLVGEGGNEED